MVRVADVLVAHIRRRSGHTKGVSAIRFIPKTAHLLLSSGMDSKVKLWEVHGKRRCIRTYMGMSCRAAVPR